MSKHQALGSQSDRLPEAIAEIMDNLDDLIWSLALPDLRPTYFNRAAQQAYGDRCQAPKDPWYWLKNVVAADRHKMQAAIHTAQLNDSCLINYRIATDGCIRHYSAKLKTFKDASGSAIRLDAIATLCKEICAETDKQPQTDRKLAQERLVKSDAHLKAAQRIGKLGSWEYDIHQDKATWSEEVFRIFGRDPAMPELSYLELKNYIHPEDFEYFDRTVQNAVQNCQPYDVDYRICRADGTLIYVSVKAEIICDTTGQPVQIVGTVLDISDRKLAELELIRSRDLRESIFNESTDALFLVDPQTLLTTDCNLPAVALFEASEKSQLIGIEGHILQRYQFSPEEIQEIALDINKHGFWSREVEYVTLKGKQFWGNLAVRVIQIAGNSINLVRVSDISDRKDFESQILKTSQELESTNQELESFCYSVSHDLRAPLRHIHGFVNALKQQINQQNAFDDPKTIHYLEVIDNSSQKMGQLIDGLLSLSRYGRRPLELKQLNLRNLVEEAIEVICGDLDCLANLRFEVGELPDIVGDPTLLEQLFRNLISNAIKFSRNHPHPCVSISSLPDRTIMIKDNGVGFQMEYADKLFGAFQRLHSEKDFEGTGIGLAIVHRIVQRHHGKVWAESQPNQGATFFIQI